MKKTIPISNDEIIPEIEDISGELGVRKNSTPTSKFTSLFERGVEMLTEFARPVGLFREVDRDEFRVIHEGEGRNAVSTPLDGISSKADRLALFAVTLGGELSEKIEALFEGRDFAQGVVLDALGSESVELSADRLERDYINTILEKRPSNTDWSILRFCPGYCGWHISGQKKIFECLNPGEIGISLNDSFLMTPLKSITGVMVVGERDIFAFQGKYEVCRSCESNYCKRSLMSIG